MPGCHGTPGALPGCCGLTIHQRVVSAICNMYEGVMVPEFLYKLKMHKQRSSLR